MGLFDHSASPKSKLQQQTEKEARKREKVELQEAKAKAKREADAKEAAAQAAKKARWRQWSSNGSLQGSSQGSSQSASPQDPTASVAQREIAPSSREQEEEQLQRATAASQEEQRQQNSNGCAGTSGDVVMLSDDDNDSGLQAALANSITEARGGGNGSCSGHGADADETSEPPISPQPPQEEESSGPPPSPPQPAEASTPRPGQPPKLPLADLGSGSETEEEEHGEWRSVEMARRNVGRRVEVYWDFQQQWYSAKITAVGEVSKQTGRVRAFVQYDDGQSQWERLWEMNYRFLADSAVGASGVSEGLVKVEEKQDGPRLSRRVAQQQLNSRTEIAQLTKVPDSLSRLVVVELHCGTGRLSRAFYINHYCKVKMVDKDVSNVEWDTEQQGVTVIKRDIDEMKDDEIVELLRGANILWVAPSCKRMSNQTAGEEQRGEYKGVGHGGEGATPQGKASDAHVLKVLQILTIARGMPGHDIKIVMENPANAGLEKLVGPGGMFEHKMKQLHLTKVVVNYCAKLASYPWKPTVLFTNSDSMIELYGNGQMQRPSSHLHAELSKNPVEAAAYPPLWAEEWAKLLVGDAKKVRAEQAWQKAPNDSRCSL